MGYYSTFNLSCSRHDLIDEFRKECYDAKVAFNEDGYAVQEVKWYDFQQDFRNFSKKHPDAIFTLNYRGEDRDDIAMFYFKGGKQQKCPAKIIFDDFDETKLY